MHLPRKLLLAFITSFLFMFANAQTKKIIGSIIGPDNAPLEGVTVQGKGTSQSTTTLSDGTFSIDLSDMVKTLIFSYIGMERQEVNISGKTNIKVQLKANSASLSDVVVIGYGTARKRDITGAVASVKGEDLKNTTAADASALLQGRAAGVVVQNSGGSPGQAPAVVIRGSGTFGND